MAADVLFGQAYFLRFDPKLWAAQQPYPPLGALYAAATVRSAGFHVALFDAMLAGSEEEWAAALDRERPRLAVLYEDSFNYLSKMCLLRMRQAALTMIDMARARGVTVIVAGSDATDHPELYLDRGGQVVIAGEGDMAVVEVVMSLSGRAVQPLADIPGLFIHSPERRLMRTRPRELLRDLDALPLPARDLVDVERYRSIWVRNHGYFSMNIATTRGCPYHCNWCAKPIWGQRYNARSAEHVADEIAWLKRTYRPDHLWIADDIFGLRSGWIERFAAAVAERGAVLPFKCLLRADGVSEPVARALAAAGCRTAWIGAESGSQRVLDAMEKGTRVEEVAEATRLLRAQGIEVGFFLQFGYPGETLDDIELTLAMVRTCSPDDIGVSVSYPLPGTPFYDRVRAQLGPKRNWVDSDDLAMMYQATYVPDFYRELHHLVHAEFRARRVANRLLRPGTRPLTLRELAGGALHALKVPLLRRQVRRLSERRTDTPATIVLPVLTRRAAATPAVPLELER